MAVYCSTRTTSQEWFSRSCSACNHLGPKCAEMESDGIERRKRYWHITEEGIDQHPLSFAEFKRFERLRAGVNKPQAANIFAGIDGALAAQVQLAGRGESTSQTQSGAIVKYAASGYSGMVSRRQPARSGTMISASSCPRCSSGSKMIHQPPGPSSPKSNGGAILAPIPELARACLAEGLGWVWRVPAITSATCGAARRARPGR